MYLCNLTIRAPGLRSSYNSFVREFEFAAG
jgi:hypothetical protein